MADRGDPWDSRASYELDEGRGRRHARLDSTASTVVGAPPLKEGYDTYQYADDQITSRPHSGGY